MKTELKKALQPTREELILLRFSVDNENQSISIEAKSNKYDALGNIVNSEPIFLVFREEKYKKAKDFCFATNISEKILHMLLRKLELDRKIESGALCETLPEGVPPYLEKSNG